MNEIANAIQDLKAFKGIKYLFLSTTVSTSNPNVYRARNKQYKNDLIIHFIFKTEADVGPVVRELEKYIDFLIVDSEDKINVSIKRALFELQTSTPEIHVKANDFTVSALVHLVNLRFGKLKTVSVIGCGNIGSKTALALAESNYSVELFSRNIEKAETIVSAFIEFGLNILTNLSARSILYIDKCESEIVILTASGQTILTPDNFEKFNCAKVIIDVGGNGISGAIIPDLKANGTLLFSLDSSPGLFGEIEKFKVSCMKYKKPTEDNSRVPLGELGIDGQLIYDPLVSEDHIIGICDGKGGIKKYDKK